MLHSGEDASPVTPIQSFVNHPVNFHVNSFALDNFVVDAAKQLEKARLLSWSGSRRAGWIGTPGFGLVFEVHNEPKSDPLTTSTTTRIEKPHSTRRNATKSVFSAVVRFSSSTRLKNSTVSSSVNSRPSCRYGGDSLIPRSGNVLIAP